jgi:hypothetical protein
VRHLDEDASAISGVRFTAACATVLEVDQHLEPARDDGVGTPACDVYDEPDATRIVFEGWIIETDSLRRISILCHAPVIAPLL